MAGKISELTPITDPDDLDELEIRDDSEAPNTDAQNKALAIKLLKGLASWKQPVRIATEVNDSLSGLAARDGVTPVAGDRVLVKAQSTASANGLYEAAAGAWTRSNDFDTDTKAIANILVPIEEGTVNADKVFQLTTNNPITIGTTSLTFAEFGAGGETKTPIIVAVGDETTILSTGTAKVTFRMPFGFSLDSVRASLTVAGTGAALVTIDVNDDGVSVFTTRVTIDATEKTSETAAAASVLTSTPLSIADDSEITIDIDIIDTDNVAAGLKVYLIGNKE